MMSKITEAHSIRNKCFVLLSSVFDFFYYSSGVQSRCATHFANQITHNYERGMENRNREWTKIVCVVLLLLRESLVHRHLVALSHWRQTKVKRPLKTKTNKTAHGNINLEIIVKFSIWLRSV